MTNKLYRGVRKGHEAKLFVDAEELSLGPSKTLHPSDATPEWSYFGEGPSQTALAILFDATDDGPNSLKYHHEFKCEFIAPADYNLGFTLLQSQVQQWLQERITRDQSMGGNWII